MQWRRYRRDLNTSKYAETTRQWCQSIVNKTTEDFRHQNRLSMLLTLGILNFLLDSTMCFLVISDDYKKRLIAIF